MSNGAEISKNEHNNIILIYPDKSVVEFDKRLKTQNGWVAGVDVLPFRKSGEMAKVKSVKRVKTKNVNTLHQELGHPSEATTRAMGKARNLKVMGSFKPCESCFVGKAKKTKVSKKLNKQSEVPGERLCIDISSLKVMSIGGKKALAFGIG